MPYVPAVLKVPFLWGIPFSSRVTFLWGLAISLAACHTLLATEETPQASPQSALHRQIDALVEREAIGPLAPQCSDAEFLRRVHLDLTGCVPTADEVTAFLADTAQDKREQLIDRLLASVEFVRHMAIELDVILLERRTDSVVPVAEWERYLIDFVAADRPINQLFQELIFFESDPTAAGPAAKFLLCRSAEPNAVTRDVGRLAFGMDMQCAQCHNHPLISGYLQEDYYGLYAFWHRTNLFTDAKKKTNWITEKADGESSFVSVFTGDGRDIALPRPPLGNVLVDEPVLVKNEAYLVEPNADQPGRPRFSRRQMLAQQLSGNIQFRRNLANRLWQKMFGRGIVHPLDLHHPENPPVHPQLLSLLADELVKQDFRLRPMLRALALTRAYQRSSREPDPDCINFQDIAARKQQLQTEQDRLSQAVALATERLQGPQETYTRLLRQQEKVAAELPKLLKAANEAYDKLAQSQTERDKLQKAKDQLTAEFSAVRIAANACAQAARVSSEDPSLRTIYRQLEAKANQLAMRVTSTEKELQPKLAAFTQAAASFDQAKAALDSADQRQLRPDDIALAEKNFQAARFELDQAIYQQRELSAKIELCNLAVQFDSVRDHDAAQADSLWRSLLEQWANRQQLAAIKPLSAEQLFVAMMQVTGNWSPHVQAASKKLQADPPQLLKDASPDQRKHVEQILLQAALLDQIRGSMKQFVGLFGGAPGEAFQATVNQALFVSNSSVIDALIKPREDNLTQKLLQVTDAELWANNLYLSILSRPATEQERQEVIELSASIGNQPETLREMQWALLSSAEFRFNH